MGFSNTFKFKDGSQPHIKVGRRSRRQADGRRVREAYLWSQKDPSSMAVIVKQFLDRYPTCSDLEWWKAKIHATSSGPELPSVIEARIELLKEAINICAALDRKAIKEGRDKLV